MFGRPPTSRPPAAIADRRHRRLPAALAAGLALTGAVLIGVAACTSQAGAPMPSADAAGTLTAATTGPTDSAPTGSTTSRPDPVTSATTAPADPLPGPSVSAVPQTSATVEPLVLPPAHPVRLAIPRIGVDSTLIELGLNADGSVAVPPLDDPQSPAGWFDGSPEPGTQGPSVILGHIDSRQYGPGVFYALGSLQPGDTIEVSRDDGTVAIFAVDGVRAYPKAEFPTLQVYGNLDHAGLRLITCGGVFDSESGHYEDNIIAFASLTGSRSA